MRMHTHKCLPNQSCAQPSRAHSQDYLCGKNLHIWATINPRLRATHKKMHPGLPLTKASLCWEMTNTSPNHPASQQFPLGLNICIPPGDIKTGTTGENLNWHLNLSKTRHETPSVIIRANATRYNWTEGASKMSIWEVFRLSRKGGRVLLCPYCIWAIIMCAYACRRTHAHALALEHITLFIRPLSPHPTAPQTLHCEPEQQPVCMWDLNTKVNLPEDYQLISTWDKTFGCI